MKKFLKNANSGIICLIEIIVGILLLVNPTAFISYILIIAGAFIAVSGVISAIKYFFSSPEEGEESQGLSKALVSVTIGAFLMIKNNIASEAIGIISLVFGAAILYTGYTKLQKAVDKIRKKQFFLVALISAAVTILCAILVLTSAVEKIIWVFIGVALIIEAAIDLTDMITGAVTGKNKDTQKSSEGSEVIEAETEETKTEE